MEAICGHIAEHIHPQKALACSVIKGLRVCEWAYIWELGIRLRILITT